MQNLPLLPYSCEQQLDFAKLGVTNGAKLLGGKFEKNNGTHTDFGFDLVWM
jgi:hypothetical protein